MNEIWPPPPTNQPERTNQSPLKGELFALMIAGVGTLILILSLSVTQLNRMVYENPRLDILAGLSASAAFLTLVAGGILGNLSRQTKHGRLAMILSCGMTLVAGILYLLPLGFI